MFDISWGEMLLIGAAALIFIGPKELPAALRALGQMTGKVRRMAGEFRSQFDEAMREADVQSIRKEFDSMNEAASSSSFNPIDTIRNELKGAVEKPVDDKDRPSDLMPSADPAPASADAAAAPVDPAIPAPEPAEPVDVSSFDVTPAAPAPVAGSAPQPPATPADASPPKPAPATEQA